MASGEITVCRPGHNLDRAMSATSFAGWPMQRQRSQTIDLEDDIEIHSTTTPKTNGQSPQAMFASFRGDLQSAIGSLNGQDSSHVSEGTRIALRQDAEGQWAWAFVPPAPHDEGVRDEGTWPRVVNVMGYEDSLYSHTGPALIMITGAFGPFRATNGISTNAIPKNFSVISLYHRECQPLN